MAAVTKTPEGVHDPLSRPRFCEQTGLGPRRNEGPVRLQCHVQDATDHTHHRQKRNHKLPLPREGSNSQQTQWHQRQEKGHRTPGQFVGNGGSEVQAHSDHPSNRHPGQNSTTPEGSAPEPPDRENRSSYYENRGKQADRCAFAKLE